MNALYSPQDPNADHPALAAERAIRTRISDVDTYPALPWSLAELPGSTWLNVATFHLVTIGTPDKAVDNYGILGTWHGAKFIIEHWIRWDVLTPYACLRWLEAKAVAARCQVADLQADLRTLDHKSKPTAPKAKAEYEQAREACAFRLVAAERHLALALAHSTSASARLEAA